MGRLATRLSPAAIMKLVGGDPGLDFVNTVGGRGRAQGSGPWPVRADKLASYSDLVAFGVHAGLLSEGKSRLLRRAGRARPRAAGAALGRALAFREALYRTLRGRLLGLSPSPADLALINTEVAAARRREVLAAEGGSLRWEWQGETEELESPLWPVARAAAALLTSPDLWRLRQCGGADCGWLFLDRSRNRRRRWCTMEDCGNLSKVTRFRQRHAGRRRPEV